MNNDVFSDTYNCISPNYGTPTVVVNLIFGFSIMIIDKLPRGTNLYL